MEVFQKKKMSMGRQVKSRIFFYLNFYKGLFCYVRDCTIYRIKIILDDINYRKYNNNNNNEMNVIIIIMMLMMIQY